MPSERYRPVAQTWQEADADALQVYIDHLDRVVYDVRQVEGKWKDRPEFRNAGQVLVDLCRNEAENVERQMAELLASVAPKERETLASDT